MNETFPSDSPTEYISHPLIKPETIEMRLYQLNLSAASLKQSTLVVLPTGLGKTIIALLVIVRRLQEKQGKVIILSPTKPLVEQHASFLKNVMAIPPEEIIILTGSIPPAKRSAMAKDARIIVSTPQVIENDLMSHRIELSEVVHITFDEAHRAVGNYAYVYIAEKYQIQSTDPLVLGITASPGSRSEKVDEVCNNLSITMIQVRTETDVDVKPYIHYRELEWRQTGVPVEIEGLKRSMENVVEDRTQQLAKLGFIDTIKKKLNKRELLDLQKRLQSKLVEGPDQRVYKSISLVAEILKVDHAIEIVQTQGPEALTKYFDRLEHEAGSKSGSKASRRLIEDVNMRHAMYASKEMDISHPKLEAVKEIVSDQLKANPDSRVIVFTNYRDTSELVTDNLKDTDNVRPVRFVGQASKYKDTGLTQKQQVDILNRFKSGEYNTLVATSVAEEGLDIPATDLVLFFEPVPSEIRSIQRKGRTGRQHSGKVIVLMAKGTKDEAYYWSSRRKEKSMNNNMRQFKYSGSSPGEKIQDVFRNNTDMPNKAIDVNVDTGVEVDSAVDAGVEMDSAVDAGVEMDSAVDAGVEMDAAVDTGVEVDAAVDTGVEMDAAVDTGVEVDAAVDTGVEMDAAVDTGVEMDAAVDTGVEVDAAVDAGVEMDSAVDAGVEMDSAVDAGVEMDSAVDAGVEMDSAVDAGVEVDAAVNANVEVDKTNFSSNLIIQKQLPDYSSNGIQIYVDNREIRSGVSRLLEASGDHIIYSNLEVGDYIVSDRIAIERKTDIDFLDSIIDKKRNLFGQLSDLARAYERPILIIEGDKLYTGRMMHPNAIKGVLVSIAADFGLPIIYTQNKEDTATFIHIMAKREQEDKKRSASLHGGKTAMTLKEQQEYIISAISNIGPVTARRLLHHFGSVENVIKADLDELLKVKFVGAKTARRIIEVIKNEYKG